MSSETLEPGRYLIRPTRSTEEMARDIDALRSGGTSPRLAGMMDELAALRGRLAKLNIPQTIGVSVF